MQNVLQPSSVLPIKERLVLDLIIILLIKRLWAV